METKNENKRETTGWYNRLKQVVLILVILQLAPIVLISLTGFCTDIFSPKQEVGLLTFDDVITDSDFYVKQIHKYLKNPHIKALLLKIDSPGGTAGSAQALFNELKKFKEKKPIVALVENVCASGSYYVAAAANHIITAPSAMIGSIGVMLSRSGMPLPNLKERMEDWKITFEYIQAGRFKSAGTFFKDTSTEEREHLQGFVNDSYRQFVLDIAQARGISVDNDTEWADGKIFTGNQALALKLVDQIGSLQEAIDELKKRTDIKTEIKFVTPERKRGLIGLLSGGDDSGSNDTLATLPAALRSFAALIYTPLALR